MKDAVILEHVALDVYRIAHQDDRIVRGAGRLFTASNGIEIWSLEFPASYSDGQQPCLRGTNVGNDDAPFIIPDDHIEAVKTALAEYNEHCRVEWGEVEECKPKPKPKPVELECCAQDGDMTVFPLYKDLDMIGDDTVDEAKEKRDQLTAKIRAHAAFRRRVMRETGKRFKEAGLA